MKGLKILGSLGILVIGYILYLAFCMDTGWGDGITLSVIVLGYAFYLLLALYLLHLSLKDFKVLPTGE